MVSIPFKSYMRITQVTQVTAWNGYFLEWLLIVTFEGCAVLFRRKYSFCLNSLDVSISTQTKQKSDALLKEL